MSSTAIVPTERAEQLTLEVRALKSNMIDNLLTLGELMSEAKANNYAEVLGFSSFKAWLDDSGLDMSERQAYYLIKIVDNARSLGIERKQLADSKMSKLKEIFSLSPIDHADKIKDLINKAPELSLEQVRNEVESTKTNAGLEPTTWMNFRVTESQAIMIRSAFEMAALQYGQIVNEETNEVHEASHGTLLADVICNGYMQAALGEEEARRKNEYTNIIDVEN
jgi:hypothetical protein